MREWRVAICCIQDAATSPSIGLTITKESFAYLDGFGVDFNSTFRPIGRMEEGFGAKLREMRQQRGLTLRALAELAGVDFTYLSKIENGRLGYSPGADTIRDLAQALGVDAMDLLNLANKLPPELAKLAGNANARRFLQRAHEVASPKDWDALLNLLETRQSERQSTKKPEEQK